MKNKVLSYTVLLLVVISLIAFSILNDKVVDSVPIISTVKIKSVIKKQSFYNYDKSYINDNRKIINDTLPESLDVVQSNEAESAYKAVKFSTICGLTSAVVTQDELDDFLIKLGETMLSDESGRMFFNQLLNFPGISVDSFDEFSDTIIDGMNSCEGYETSKDDYLKIFHLLNVAAKNGNTEAMVFLWMMQLPEYMIAKAKNFQNHENLDYLQFFQEKKIWQETKLAYLYEAARLGEKKAWVLLGDTLSSDKWILPNLLEAYKYYYAASKHYQFPFITDKLSTLENYLTKDEIKQGKTIGENLFRQFN